MIELHNINGILCIEEASLEYQIFENLGLLESKKNEIRKKLENKKSNISSW